MSKRTIAAAVPSVVLLTAVCAFAQGGGGRGAAPETLTASRLPNNPQSTAHIEGARKLAGSDPVLTQAWNFFCTPTNYNTPAPEIEPMKVFDNLYEIPSSTRQQTIVWAITTHDGIILIDSGEQGRTEAVIAGMQKVGLDPSQVKYILLGHGHGDHFGGAAYFQQRYGTRVGSSAADWDVIHPPGAPAEQGGQNPRPKRDLVLAEGTPIVLGGQTVHVVNIPGHTPGSLAFIFNVTDSGRTHTAGLFGGTILDQGRITTEGLQQYLRSIARYLEIARKRNVDVQIQNHALFDDTPGRLARLRARTASQPHPFLMSTDSYVNLWNLVSECIRAEIARRSATSAAN